MRTFPGVRAVQELGGNVQGHNQPRRRVPQPEDTNILPLSDDERLTLFQVWRSPERQLWLTIRDRLMDGLYRALRFSDPEKSAESRAQMALLDRIFGPEGGNGEDGLIGRTVAAAAEKGFAPTEVGVGNVE
jgi:hypothetical protein